MFVLYDIQSKYSYNIMLLFPIDYFIINLVIYALYACQKEKSLKMFLNSHTPRNTLFDP